MNLYIDTNIYLTFYHLSSDDLEELRKLIALIKDKNITLYLPEQTKNEFRRNREVKISDSLKTYDEQKLNNSFPQMCKGYPEFKELQKLIDKYNEQKSKLREKLQGDILHKKLRADNLISELFGLAYFIPISEDIITKAKRRYDLGNPPGKDKSYGDAINWETLLKSVPDNKELYIISDDKDYKSILDSNNFNNFLEEEWAELKKNKVFYFKRLADFFRSKYPNIKLASEYQKDSLIKKLTTSNTFHLSRTCLKKLNEFEDFSSKQINDIVLACISNSQIYNIARYENLNVYLDKIIKTNISSIENANLERLNKILNIDKIENPTPDLLDFSSEYQSGLQEEIEKELQRELESDMLSELNNYYSSSSY